MKISTIKEPEELYRERVERIKAAMDLKEPDRVPFIPPEEGDWVCAYAELSTQEAMYDYEKYAKAWEKVIKDFPGWDAAYQNGLYSGPMLDAAGVMHFALSGREISPDSMLQYPQKSYMKQEEYDLLIKDPYEYMLKVRLPRTCKEIAKPYPRNLIALTKAAFEYSRWISFWDAKIKEWARLYGMPVMGIGFTEVPFDILGDHFRGFREVLLDIHRIPDKVKAACEALLPYSIKWGVANAGSPKRFPLLFLYLHLAPTLSPKSFEEFYWPTFKKVVEALVRRGYGLYIEYEIDWTTYLDYLVELPKRETIAHFEHMDMAKAKEVLGGHTCIMGNLPTDLLVVGTPKEVEKYTKKLIEEAGEGGGYIMSASHTFARNVKAENLRAWMKATIKYGSYKK